MTRDQTLAHIAHCLELITKAHSDAELREADKALGLGLYAPEEPA